MTPINLTIAESKHILSLISVNTRDGWYHSPREQYWKRSDRIKEKIQSSLLEKDNPNATMIGSLSKTHATKREAVAMLAIIIDKIKESKSMSETVKLAGIDPLELYAPIKIGSKWYIKATDKHLKSAKTLQLAHRQRKI